MPTPAYPFGSHHIEKIFVVQMRSAYFIAVATSGVHSRIFFAQYIRM